MQTDSDDLYNIKYYTDEQLYNILDINHPTDRELEAKIIHLINKYENMQNETGHKMSIFFQNIYNHFFVDEEDDDENDNVEGFETQKPNATSVPTPSASAAQTSTPKPSAKPTEYNPLQISNVQQLDYSADKLQLNPLLKQTIKRVISIDSQYRDINTSKMTTNFTFDLSEPLRDVVSLKLYSVQIPYTWYTISKSYGSNFLYLKGISSGVNDGLHDYKIEINSGNYTAADLVAAINASFQDLSNNSASDVNFNGLPLLTYDSTTSKTTVNLNLQQTYSEPYYQLYFPFWTPPVTPSIENRSLSIPAYLGFNNQIYYPYAIQSNQSYRTTVTVNAQTSQDFYLDNSNNYFTVIQYIGYTEFEPYNSVSTVLRTIKIQMTQNGLNVVGNATRADIINYVNTAIQSSGYFESSSGMTQVDIPVSGSIQNAGYTYFRLNLVLNRKTVKYYPNAKLVVLFPNESSRLNQYGETYSIWNLLPGLTTSCFYFDNSMNEFSQFVSETPSVQSTYSIDLSANMFLKCTTPYYNTGLNDFSMNVPTGNYTLNQYLSAITNTFSTKNAQLGYNLFNMTNTYASIDTSNKFNLQIDMTKTFTNKNYYISFGLSSLLCRMGSQGYGPGFSPTLVDLSSQNIFGANIQTIYTGYAVDVSYIFTIHPYTGYGNDGNGAAPPVTVCLPSTYTYPYYFPTFNTFISGIQNAIANTVVEIPSINDSQTPLSKSTVTYTVNANNTIDLSLNIFYSYFLSESNYDISFSDGIKDISNVLNAWYPFDISTSYNLFTQTIIANSSPTAYYPYAVIYGNSQVKGGESINVLDGSNNIILTTYGVNGVPSDNITISVTPGTYTTGTLYTEINNIFAHNPKTYGSTISSYVYNNQEYCLIRLNINRVFTTADYKLVFYDPISFVTCYAGSRNVQNTTWDSTVGWILGFRDYTEYTLIKSNQVQDNNFKDKYYYLASSNGSYTYSTTTNKNSGLLTNSVISLTGDTTLSTNLYNYFLISLDDYIQNHLNDGLVTITRSQTAIPIPSYANTTRQTCDPSTKTVVRTSVNQSNSDNVSNNQLYSLNQSAASNQNILKTYSAGPYVKDLFGIVPLRVPAKNGDYYIEFGGSLQNQERLYFGPVNIRKMTIQLLNDRGDIVDLNGSNWSFSFICEQLYRATST
jgi:hypothetical protein